MANQKNKEEALNVEEVLSSSEAFILKNKKTIVGSNEDGGIKYNFVIYERRK